MVFLSRILRKAMLVALVFAMGVLMHPVYAPAEPDILKNFSFDDCDPFEARALIMEVYAKKAQLVAAEQIIYVVDLNLGDGHLITELTDPEGKRIDFGAFSRGQWVYVKGFKHIDGGVVASLVQRIEPPEHEKPVLRKISKKSPRHNRTGDRASGIRN